MDTFLTIVLALAVLILPIAGSYIVIERLARRRSRKS